MSEVRLSSEVRTEFGKGASRRARRDGKVPAVLYGHGTDPRHLLLNHRELVRALKHGANTVMTLDIDGTEELALPKVVVKHPLRDYVEHIDLLLVVRGETVTVDVPVHVTGEAAAATVVLTEATTVSVEAEALHIPEAIEVSIEGLEAGAQILAGQIALPSGVNLVTDAEALIVAVQAAEVEASEDEAAEEAGEDA